MGCNVTKSKGEDNLQSTPELPPRHSVDHVITNGVADDKPKIHDDVNSKPEENTGAQLKLDHVNFQIKENRVRHLTHQYKLDNLIIRRGQEFTVTMTFDQTFDVTQSQLIMLLTFGSNPKESKRSLTRVKVTNNLDMSSWGMRIDSINVNSVSLTIMPPANALIGEYSVFVETKTKEAGSNDKYITYRSEKLPETFIVLFNAWCKDDPVYMENEESRQEFVMNDHGRIWYGSKRTPKPYPWYFGQFEDVVLKSCLYVLGSCKKMNDSARGNPVLVSRIISQMTNVNDDGGILVGNWSGEYGDGKNPSAWAGSVAILKEYLNEKPVGGVKYGQCWVFSGLVTTLLRTIGIPTRSVTNFESAHDTDASMTIDMHNFKDTGEPVDFLNGDSVWNFHVWNESYFDRPDLPAGYSGWQVIDATPQELSHGVYCCGPCPVKAIKQGEVYLPYDSVFVFGEVNGDRVYWDVDKSTMEMTVATINKRSIGKCISTKAIGSNDRHDITDCYKHPEGSDAERDAVHKAHAFSSRKDDFDIYRTSDAHDVVFDFLPPNDDLIIGSDFDVQLKMTNTSSKPRTIKFSMVAKIAFYTGITAVDLNKVNDTIVIQPNEEKIMQLPVPADDYLGRTPAEARVKVYLKATVQQTKQEFNDIETIEFTKPTIEAEFTTPKEKEKFKMTLFFTNPLQIPLNDGVFNIESSRYLDPDTITKVLTKPVNPHEKVSTTIAMESESKGWRSVNASFTSKELSGVAGEIYFEVQ